MTYGKNRRVFVTAAIATQLMGVLLTQSSLAQDNAGTQDNSGAGAIPAEKFFGTTVYDPYRWMEDSQSPRVTDWAAEQTSRSTQYIIGAEPNAAFDAMQKRIYELSNFDLRFAAKIRGERLFFMKRPKGGAPVELWVKEGKASSRILKSDQVPDREYEQTFIGGRNFGGTHWPDPTGSMLAYGYNDGVSRGARIRILDVETGLHLEDEINEVGHGLLSLVWAADGRGFYYTRARSVPLEDGSGERVQPLGVYYHRLATPQSSDIAVITPQGDDRMIYTPFVSVDGKRLFVSVREGLKQQNSYLVYETSTLQSEPVALFNRLESRFRFLGDKGNRLYFQTFHDAPNGRIIYVDLDKPETLVEVVPETERSMLVGSSVGGDIIGYADGHFMIGFLQDGVPTVSVYNTDGAFLYTLDIPPGQTIWGGIQGVASQPVASISALSALSPAQISSVDLRTGQITKLFDTPIAIDPDDFIIERVFYTSRDGTRVPMYVARHRDTRLDGSNPALIYGYGMHNWVSFLFYQPHILHFLELGGVYAMPAIRGGGEYGERWHQAGIRANRQNAVDDFVSAGRWLIDQGYTSAKKLAANGSSASGPIAGIIAIRHGDIFAASTVDYPVADTVRARLFGNGALMTEEYGSLDVEAEAKSIIHQSPYHQAQKPACRIPTLVMVGEKDRVVLPFHGFKLAAALQENQRCEKPILFRLMPETGHNYGNTPERIAENASIQLMFLRKTLEF